jgi:predicted secreted protein
MTTIRVVAHCLMNPETRLPGLRPIDFQPEPPIIQLLCPEAGCLGLDRWAVTKNQIDIPSYRRYCREVFSHHADLIEQFAKKGREIEVVGVEGSPSCGINSTTSGYTGGKIRHQDHDHIPGMGVFMEVVAEELKRRCVPFRLVEAKKIEDPKPSGSDL